MTLRPRREEKKNPLDEQIDTAYLEEQSEAKKESLRCFSTKNCGAGFACIGGYCIKENLSSTQTCQDQKDCQPRTAINPTTGCTEDDCSCCNKGTRKVRLYGGFTATAKCFDTKVGVCDPFMNSYYQLFGKLPFGLTPETLGGSTEGVLCDECSDCDSNLNCVPKTEGPCWCEQLSCAEQCTSCSEDGLCRRDCGNCIRKYYGTCCGEQVSVYGSACLGGRKQADKQIKENCEECLDCTPKVEYKTYCDKEPPPCPPEATCVVSGVIEAGGRTCTLVNETYDSELPEHCDLCKDVVCGKCEICNPETGACEIDPECSCRWTIDPVESFRTSGGQAELLNLADGDDRSVTMEEIASGVKLTMTPSVWEPTASCAPGNDCVVTSVSPSETVCSGTGSGCSLEKSVGDQITSMVFAGHNECATTTGFDLNGSPYAVAQRSGCQLTVKWFFECS